MKFIRKETEEWDPGGMIEKYFYDDIGGEKGALNILRDYEKSGYKIKNIIIPYESDHSAPYMGPHSFCSIDEYIYGSPFKDHFLVQLTKGVFEYTLSVDWGTNEIWLWPETIGFPKLPPYHELHTE